VDVDADCGFHGLKGFGDSGDLGLSPKALYDSRRGWDCSLEEVDPAFAESDVVCCGFQGLNGSDLWGACGFVFPNALNDDFWLPALELDAVDPGGDHGANGFCFSEACGMRLSNSLCDFFSLAWYDAPEVELPLTVLRLSLCVLGLADLEDDPRSFVPAEALAAEEVDVVGFQGLKGFEVSRACGLLPPPKALYEAFSWLEDDDSRESVL
jgi:hypothetical protein